jgi:hypothetical protein
MFPNQGVRLNASSGWSYRENPFPYLELNFDHFQPLGGNFTAFAVGRTDTSFGKKLGLYDQFTAGGLNQLDAYRFQEIRGDTLLMAGGGLLYRGMNPNTAQFRPIFGAWYQAASIDWRTSNSDFKDSAAVGVFAPTPLGIAGLHFQFRSEWLDSIPVFSGEFLEQAIRPYLPAVKRNLSLRGPTTYEIQNTSVSAHCGNSRYERLCAASSGIISARAYCQR